MYLEISNIAAAIGKNPYEPVELIYLTIWARENPQTLIKYLIENQLIISHNIEEDEVDEEMNLAYNNIISSIDKKNFSTTQFNETTEKVIEEYKQIRPNFNKTELDKLETSVKSQLIKDNGNIQEENTINKKKYQKGNNKMWYYNIDNNVIGGKHDADENGLVIEIKSRTSMRNVRKNEYDLYQLIGYLMCMNKEKGKIVQNFNKIIFDSDYLTDKEFGIVNIKEEKWINYKNEIIEKLKLFFNECKTCIEKESINLDKIYKFGKIAEITEDGRLININSKYAKICKLIN